MSPEKENSLVSAYPSLFRDVYKHPDKSLMFFGCECGDGWFGIINAACGLISKHCERTGLECYWSQIKEKFGTLRLYAAAGGHDPYVRGVISMAEEMSGVTCDQCGSPGETTGEGWMFTRCERCR
jgi:hypothetical protein